MKKYLTGVSIATIVFLSQIACADELIQMSNGMTCWRNDAGHMYGCSGGSSTGDSGFNDVKTGKRYERINDDQAIDTQTGQPIYTPYRGRNGSSGYDGYDK